ncbi:hypothetical protein K402DRAFT_457233 [Aulographum hederae CBS 113979]|uniref:Uncharacterized protein n=1 Tax=Aulographum hederae CBS 113979 TaxID=1176131 RepID=A0A6G1GP65_9PEZI|nr:hypothetical protein K402DRAFT_457233 [Aulographum hederae CBS 113979]
MSDKAIPLSEKEMRLLALAWQCFDIQPKVDYNKLAALAGYTSGSASVMLGRIKRKLAAAAKDVVEAAEAAAAADDDEAARASPVKKGASPVKKGGAAGGGMKRKTPVKFAKKGEDSDEEGEGEDGAEKMTPTPKRVKRGGGAAGGSGRGRGGARGGKKGAVVKPEPKADSDDEITVAGAEDDAEGANGDQAGVPEDEV